MCPLQPQAAIDDAERDGRAAPVRVEVSPDGAVAVLGVEDMVGVAEEGLDEEGGEDGEADDGVVVGYLQIH